VVSSNEGTAGQYRNYPFGSLLWEEKRTGGNSSNGKGGRGGKSSTPHMIRRSGRDFYEERARDAACSCCDRGRKVRIVSKNSSETSEYVGFSGGGGKKGRAPKNHRKSREDVRGGGGKRTENGSCREARALYWSASIHPLGRREREDLPILGKGEEGVSKPLRKLKKRRGPQVFS